MLSPEQKRKLIVALSFKFGVDPRAALAVAMVEGGFAGAIGDSGTSFGPYQLHEGGALPEGKGHRWANSRAGITYALRQLDAVAGGMHGRKAIANIVRRFERPADIPGEIAKAWGLYGDIRLPHNMGQDMWRPKDVQNNVQPAAAPAVNPRQALAAMYPQSSMISSLAPNPTTVQGVSSMDLYRQLHDIREQLLTA
jgi:hypothetical protein